MITDEDLDLVETQRLIDAIGRRTYAYILSIAVSVDEAGDTVRIANFWKNRLAGFGLVNELVEGMKAVKSQPSRGDDR